MPRRDAFLFGLLLALSATLFMGMLIYSCVRQGFRGHEYVGIAICAAIGVFGFFIARAQSFWLLAIAAPLTFFIAIAPLGSAMGTHTGWGAFFFVALTLVILLLNISALVDAWRLRRYYKYGVMPEYHSDQRYWLSRGIIFFLMLIFIPVVSFLGDAIY